METNVDEGAGFIEYREGVALPFYTPADSVLGLAVLSEASLILEKLTGLWGKIRLESFYVG